MNFLRIIIFAAGVLNFLLGLTVLKRNIKSKVNLSFSVFALTTSVWALANYFLLVYQSLFLLRMAYALGALVVSFGLSWIFILSDSKKSKVPTISYISGILFFILNNTPLVVNELIEFSYSGSIIKYGLLFYPYSVYVVSLLFIMLFKIFFASRSSQGHRKGQLYLVFLGAAIFGAFSIIASFIFPLFGIEKYIMLDSPSSLIFISFSTYAIVRHRLMDIRMVVARSVAYTLLIATLAVFYAGAIFSANALIFPESSPTNIYIAYQAFLGLIMAFTFQPLRRFLTRVTDKIFFKNDYILEDLLKELTNTANGTLILIELLYRTIDILIKKMKVTRAVFVLLDEKGTIYTTQSLQYQKIPKFTDRDILYLSKQNVVVFDELEEGSRLKGMLRRFEASLSLSIISEEGKPIGILLLGEKESGDMYSSKDTKLFEILMPELSIAIHRAREHEKVQKFNVTLQVEVARKTKELQDANEHLRELDKAKDEFISMASHQLRTPLTAIKGYLSMLLEGDAGEIKMAQYDFVNEAFNASSRMVGLINDLLNVSRMETGRFFLEPVEVDVVNLVQEEMKQLKNHADDKKIYLNLEVAKKKLPKITADETKLRQVVMNFIDNAIYYTQKGGITITIDTDEKYLICKVTDTGIGVPEAQKRSLFTKFYRADNARRVRPDGTGLGIYLAKKVIEDHGGELIFESTEGKGSTFGFRFPLEAKISEELTTPPPDLAVKIEPEDLEKIKEAKEKKEPALAVPRKEAPKEKNPALY